MQWQTSRFLLDLGRPRVMGIVNVTPDSFSDGGRHFASTRTALAHVEQLLRDGADVLDIGGESSRPGTPGVPLDEERARVLPVLREAVRLGVPISIDTAKPELMREALDIGADILNDVSGFRREVAVEVAASHPACGLCVMHMHGEPRTMQREPMAGDALPQVRAFLEERTRVLVAAGVAPSRICWDPGVGFGKTAPQNIALLARQGELRAGHPLLVGWSRKSTLGTITGDAVHERLGASIAAAVLAVDRGARIVRVHDVRETVSALKVWQAATEAASGSSSNG